MHRGEKGADLRGGHDIRRKEVFKGEFQVVWSEVFGRLDELFQQPFELIARVLRHRD